MGDDDTTRMSVQSVTVKVHVKNNIVDDIVTQSAKKFRITSPENYGLMTFDGFLSQNGVWLQEEKKVVDYKLKHNVRVT